MRLILASTLILLATAPCLATTAEPPRFYLAEDWAPPVLDGIELPAGVSTLTVSPDGRRAAASVAGAEGGRRGTILLYSIDNAEPVEVEVAGIVRDLLFEPDSMTVLGLLHRPAKKREGDTYLIRLDFDAPKPRRMLHLPASARGMDYWPFRGMLLIAVRNEIRLLTLPGLRSGPLYRIPGENLAVASLGEGSKIVVGQDDALLLVDLDDSPGEEAMPVREERAVSRPVRSLAAANDGSRVLARLEDGTVWSILTGPLRAEQLDGGAMLAATEKIPSRPAPADPEPEPAEPQRSTPPATSPAAAPVIPIVESESAARPEPAPAAVEPAPAPEALAGSTQLRGRIGGPAANMVAHVVLFGPDNILKEARRIVPGEDGSWEANGLPAGRYRVQLDGGGQRVLVTEPASLILELPSDGNIETAEIRVLEAL